MERGTAEVRRGGGGGHFSATLPGDEVAGFDRGGEEEDEASGAVGADAAKVSRTPGACPETLGSPLFRGAATHRDGVELVDAAIGGLREEDEEFAESFDEGASVDLGEAGIGGYLDVF